MSENDLKEVIARRLRLAREQAGLSQAQVAKLLGLHRPSVSELEAGRRSVSAQELSKLAEIYEVDVTWLAGDKGEKLSIKDDKIGLAARELAKLDKNDIDTLLQILSSLKQSSNDENKL
jgi:transcriptional regulator with XRE-family HTH domain